MTDLWKEVTTWLSETTKSAIKETEDLARRGRIKMEVLGINTALNDKFTALGGVVYEIIKKGGRSSIKNNPKVKKLAIEIAKLEAQLEVHKKEPGEKKPKQASQEPGAKKSPTKKKTSGSNRSASSRKTAARTKAKRTKTT